MDLIFVSRLANVLMKTHVLRMMPPGMSTKTTLLGGMLGVRNAAGNLPTRTLTSLTGSGLGTIF